MKIERIIDGKSIDEMCKMKVFIVNSKEWNVGNELGEWTTLPITGTELGNLCKRIGIKDGKQYDVIAIDFDGASYPINDEDLNVLNEVAKSYNDCSFTEQVIYETLVKNGYGLLKAMDIVRNKTYTLYSDCYTIKQFAEQYILSIGLLLDFSKEYEIDLHDFIDFEKYGKYLQGKLPIFYTPCGYIEINI